MDKENSLLSNISPLCFAIISDKIKERNAALVKLHIMLPDTVKSPEFSSDVAAKVLKSFMDWVSTELRGLKKSSSLASNNLVSLKELKWVLGLFDEEFGRIRLCSSQLFEIIDRLSDVISLGVASNECLYILNQYLLSKTCYSNHIRNSKQPIRVNKLLQELCKNVRQSDSPDSFIKSISFLAICLPTSLKVESDTYSILHDAFIWYLSRNNFKNDNLLIIVVSAVNYILLDYFEHSTLFATKYFEYFISCLYSCKNFVLCNKIIQFFLQSRASFPEDLKSVITDLLSKELEQPQHFTVGLVEPVSFCKHLVDEYDYNYNEIALVNFFELCSLFGLAYKSSLPFAIFKIIKGEIDSKTLATIPLLNAKRTRYAQDWNALAKFFCSAEESLQNSSGSSKEIRWFVLWYVCRNHSQYKDLCASDLDSFALSCIKNGLDYSDLALSSILEYFLFRFGNLFWTKSAKLCYESIFDSLLCLTTPPPLSIPLLNLILMTTNADFFASVSDSKIKDLELFRNRLKHVESLRAQCFPSSATCLFKSSNDFVVTDVLMSNISSIIERIQKEWPDNQLKFFLETIYSLIESSETFKCEYLFSSFNQFSFSVIDSIKYLIPKRIPITDLLSVLIPAVQEEVISANYQTQPSTVVINTAEIYRQSLAGEEPLIKISKLLYKSYHDHFQTFPKDSEEHQILTDWNTFMTELTGINLQDGSDLKLSSILTECRPYFDIDLRSIKIDDISFDCLPAPKSIYKSLRCPEQWYPFIFIVLKSKNPSSDLMTEWLYYFFSTTGNDIKDSFLKSFIFENCSLICWQNLFRRWIEADCEIRTFPFPPNVHIKDFIIKNAHFSQILARFPSFDAMIKVFGLKRDEVFEDPELLAHLMASCLFPFVHLSY